MAKYEIVFDERVASINNHIKPFEIIEAEDVSWDRNFVYFTVRTPYPNKGLMMPDTIETKVWYNINSIIKITKLD